MVQNNQLVMSTKPIVLSFEGNIGAGKSTILSKLQTYIEYHSSEIPGKLLFMKEPVDQWTSITHPESGENILQKFYADPKTNAFAFQIMAYTTRMNTLKQLITDNHKEGEQLIIICERCLETDKEVFAKMLYDDGMIDELHYQIYNLVSLENPYKTSGIIYLETDPDVCYERINRRSRSGEQSILIDYLKKCHDYHETWFSKTNPSILKLNVNQDVTYDLLDETDLGTCWIKSIVEFITTYA
jgi:deoxyadenosine/deoxycytidine kinase